ncbi:small membrane protein YdgU [Enterobacter hormaechei]
MLTALIICALIAMHFYLS